MSKLYEDLAEVYEAMYDTFINYPDEYSFYSKIIKEYSKKSVLEIGSGTGNLAQYFIENGFEYLGMDFSESMIAIAQRKNKTAEFFHGDMRNFKLNTPVESIIITGRTISYLLTNEDLNNTFTSIYKNLSTDGIVCFDFIDANKFIPQMLIENEIIHKATKDGTAYQRKGTWNLVLKNGMDFKWDAIYYKEDGDELIEIGQDHPVVRTFMVNEIELFLTINGFKNIRFIERASYFFPTYIVVASK